MISRSYLVALALGIASFAHAQNYSSGIAAPYLFTPDVSYLKLGAWEGKLDIYTRSDSPGPHPTLVFFHGGSDDRGTKETELFNLIRYLELGWDVVNVEHRLPGVTLAPAAMQNGWCALRWVVRNAPLYGFDPNRLVVSGQSAGGWAALTTAMVPNGWADELCPGKAQVKVAAVVNWYGVTDPAALLEGERASPGLIASFRSLPNSVETAKSISPVHMIRPSVPPVITIHGEADDTVPYAQAMSLHAALKGAGVIERLIPVPRGRHGGFPQAENRRAYVAIEEFLAELGIVPVALVDQNDRLPTPSAISLESNFVSRYVGRYRANSGDILSITRQGERIYVQQNSRQRPMELFASAERDFFVGSGPSRIRFVVDEEGHAFGMIVYGNGRYTPLPKVD